MYVDFVLDCIQKDDYSKFLYFAEGSTADIYKYENIIIKKYIDEYYSFEKEISIYKQLMQVGAEKLAPQIYYIDEDKAIIVMEYIDLVTLDEYFESFNGNVNDMVTIIKNICMEVKRFVDLDIYPNDLHGDNILIDKSNFEISLIDYGQYNIGKSDYLFTPKYLFDEFFYSNWEDVQKSLYEDIFSDKIII